jgi:hypothetical protein
MALVPAGRGDPHSRFTGEIERRTWRGHQVHCDSPHRIRPRRAPDEGSLFVRGRQLAPVPGGGRLRFQGFKPAVVPAFLDVMSGGNIGKTIVDIAG